LILGFKALELTREKAAHGQVESIRKMLLAFSQDLRVVFIYLASRLQTLRWVTQKEIVPETAWAQEILENHSRNCMGARDLRNRRGPSQSFRYLADEVGVRRFSFSDC